MSNYSEILKQWQNYKISTVDDLDFYLDNFRILFAYNSNSIENPNTTYHDTREIFEYGKVSSYTGDLRTLFEIQNQKECYDFLKEKIVSKEPLSQKLILEIHKILMHGCYDKAKYDKRERPGQYKKHLFIVGDDIGVEPEDVPEEMQYVIDQVNENEGKDPLTVAAYLHLSFETIHPFADGNGRVGRTLLNYYLITHNHPPVIIFAEDKETYYLALATFDKTEKIDGFKQFIREQAVKTWGKKPHKRCSLSETEQ
ncbi:MAG: Fic family protein [Acutalibacteraceae bacterium]